MVGSDLQEKIPFSKNATKVLNSCQKSILGIRENRIYLDTDYLKVMDRQFYLKNDTENWTCFQGICQDGTGYYVDMKEALCPNGHIGIKRILRTWYCFDSECEYFIGNIN